MTDFFKEKGRALLANGYSIVPIRPGEKRPALSEWQRSRLGVSDLSSYPGCGVGVLCGVGAVPIVGVDVDISHPVVGPAVVEWCETNLGMAPKRVGDAPRVLLVYRADNTGWTKGFSTAFYDPTDTVKSSGKRNEQRVEILCAGQQFVAYHRHPDTGRDYEWIDLFGGIETLRAEDLSQVTEAQVSMLLAFIDLTVRATVGVEVVGEYADVGLAGEGGGLESLTTTCGLSEAQCREYLQWHDAALHDHWVKVGMALHHEANGEQWGLDLWDEWSRQADNWQAGVCATRWASFGRGGHAPTTMRWVIKLAGAARRDHEKDRQQAALDVAAEGIRSARTAVEMEEVLGLLRKDLPESPLLLKSLTAVLRAQCKQFDIALTETDAVKMLRGERERGAPTVFAKRPLTEFGNSERMLDRYGQGLVFVPETGQWHVWTGQFWRATVEAEIEHLAKETVRGLASEAGEHPEPAEFFKFAANSQSIRMVKNMVSLGSSDPRVCVPARELDKDLDLLGVPNGVVDLRTGELRVAAPELRVTMVAGVAFDAAARCPLFEQTVLDAFQGDRAMADYFQRLMGYTLSGRPTHQLLAILYGMGANGKSTILNAVRKAFGDYARVADASSFISDGRPGGGGGPREDLVRLRGARMVYVSEPDEGGELREGAVKAMTGGESIVARSAYAKHSVEVEPTWTVIMPTNHKPIVKGSDYGIWRRLELIEFGAKFAGEKADPNRPEKLLQELPGILAWVIAGLKAYRKMGLQKPAKLAEAKVLYQEQMDLLSDWLDQCCVLDQFAETEVSALWASWENYARTNGCLNYVKSSIALGRRLEPKFPVRKTSGGLRVRPGIRLKMQFTPPSGG